MNIQEKIEKIINDNGKSIIVLQGIPIEKLSRNNKLFSFDIKNYDKIDMDDLEKEAIRDIKKNWNFKQDYLWMTIEEFQLFKQYKKLYSSPIIILTNNLYDKQFPYQGTLSDIKEVYQELYYQNDQNVDSALQKKISKFYGKIDYSKGSNNYYVTYPETDDLKTYSLYDVEKIQVKESYNIPKDNIKKIELSDNEIPFLDLEKQILINKKKQNIVFVLTNSKDELPNNYLNRISILCKISSIKIYFTKQTIKQLFIENEQNYLNILKRIVGEPSPSFRKIDFYSDISHHSTKTVAISQAQIIDDIVSQAENALNNEQFRDIYITAATGSGKSVIFQVPALYLAKKYPDDKPLTIVISPLIALMNDQVEKMKQLGINSFATINGSTLPHDKDNVINRIQKQEVNVLYLSPETLQARNDITTIIGDRKIGIVIIDEAHIVTTWGRSFRADYWYLGIYLAKLRKKYKFPIVTFTATAIYGGREDMYRDTINSLEMLTPISYFGVVRRDDIKMIVRNAKNEFTEGGKDYRKAKIVLTMKHISAEEKAGHKTLVYFPTIKLSKEVYNELEHKNMADKVRCYNGKMEKTDRNTVQNLFKAGEIDAVLATKAFGMGVDIPDISSVYHYAPTGTVVDYVQEIGRVARDKTKIKYGVAKIDFLSPDMNEVKKLYGMSTIRKSQILAIMDKILALYKEKGQNRNLVVSSEDFKYIFYQNKYDEDNLDNKIKTVLLMIEKDFEGKIGYSPFYARPRSLYGTDMVFMTPKLKQLLNNSRLNNYFKKQMYINSKSYNAVYQVDLSGIWGEYYKYISYPEFKYRIYSCKKLDGMKDINIFQELQYSSGIEIVLSKKLSKIDILTKYKIILQIFEDFINQNKLRRTQFTIDDLDRYLTTNLHSLDRVKSRSLAQILINISFQFNEIFKENRMFIKECFNKNTNNTKYMVSQGVEEFIKYVNERLYNLLNPQNNYYLDDKKITIFRLHNGKDKYLDMDIAILGIGESTNLLSYQMLGGGNPQIYLRINSVYPLEQAIGQENKYKNNVLNDVMYRHYVGVAMLEYLFTHNQPEKDLTQRINNYSNWFWDTIEKYFMGELPQEVKERLIKKNN